MTQPKPGSTWQHFKHTPETPHLYTIICVTEAGELPMDAFPYFTVVHTETGALLDLMASASTLGRWIYPVQVEPFVVYLPVNDNGKWWARPLSSFMAPDDRSPTGQKFWPVPTA